MTRRRIEHARRRHRRESRIPVAIDVKATTLRELEVAANHATACLGKDLDVRQSTTPTWASSRSTWQGRSSPPPPSARSSGTSRAPSAGACSSSWSNPFDGVRLPKVQAKAVRVYSAQEVQAMLDVAASGWWRCRVCGATGPGVVADRKRWKCPTIRPDGERCPGNMINVEPSLWWEAFIRLAYTAGPAPGGAAQPALERPRAGGRPGGGPAEAGRHRQGG